MTVRTPVKVVTEIENQNESDDSMEHETSSNNDDANADVDDVQVESDDEFGDDADNESEENDDGNSGWADAFAKVLQQEKPKNKKYLVLSKAKKLADRKGNDEDDKPTFEILMKDERNGAKEEKDAETESKPTKEELEWTAMARKEKNNKLLELRVIPSEMDVEREKSFKRIAQKGVVQLFNAVRAQHRDLVDQLEKAGPLDHKRDAVLNNINKGKFLDMLMGSKRAKSEQVDNPVKSEDNTDDPTDAKPSQWSVLRDDFMTNKNTSSHWDNDDDSGNDDNGINDDDDDDDGSSDSK